LIRLWDTPPPSDTQSARLTAVFAIRTRKPKPSPRRSRRSTWICSARTTNTCSANRDEKRAASQTTYIFGDAGNTEPDRRTQVSFKGKLSIGVDPISNTLLVSTEGQTLMDNVSRMIQALDEAAKPVSEVRVVALQGNVNAQRIRQVLSEMLLENSVQPASAPMGNLPPGGAPAADVLRSHRGWDPGSLEIGRLLSRELAAPLLSVAWSRLLVEANRSPTNPRIWSPFTAKLPAAERQRILERYWWPHRNEVEAAVAAGAVSGRRVVHIAIHSFTGVLDGQQRNAEIGLLYDPIRTGEANLCKRWIEALHELLPDFRVRRNYPYRGNTDGLTTWLRRKFPDATYAGIELELNQTLLASSDCRRLKQSLGASLSKILNRRE
jgi:predicted N-formylglutamate amidohydrolase